MVIHIEFSLFTASKGHWFELMSYFPVPVSEHETLVSWIPWPKFYSVKKHNYCALSVTYCAVTNYPAHTLHWRHHEHDGVSPLATRQFTQPFIQAQMKENIKVRITGLCEGNSPVTGDSNAENVSIWWRHHDFPYCLLACSVFRLLLPYTKGVPCVALSTTELSFVST